MSVAPVWCQEWEVWARVASSRLPLLTIGFFLLILRLVFCIWIIFFSRRCQVVPWQTQGSAAEAHRMLGTLQQPDFLLWDKSLLFFLCGRKLWTFTHPLAFIFLFFIFMFFIFSFEQMSVLCYLIRMRSGLLLFLFAQVFLVASLTQTGRCWRVEWIHVAWQQAV